MDDGMYPAVYMESFELVDSVIDGDKVLGELDFMARSTANLQGDVADPLAGSFPAD
jgi:hypothetical protein